MNTDKKGKAKKTGRKRRTLGWTLLILGLLVAAVWVWSGWYLGAVSLWTSTETVRLFVRDGEAVVLTSHREEPLSSIPALRWESNRRHATWMVHFERPRYEFKRDGPPNFLSPLWVYTVWFPIWPVPLLLCAPAALLLRSGILARRRAITGRCEACGYDLAGLTKGAPCPECGKAAATTQAE